MKVLIISYFFPPLNSIASLRPYSWARYFSEQGVDVTVLTTRKHKFENDLDLSFDGFKVVEIPVPKPFKIISLGRVINFFNRVLSWGIYYKVRFPDESYRWVKPAFKWASNYQWDVVISSALPHTVHEVAYLLKKNQKCKIWIADWRDLFSENPIYTGLLIFKNIEKALEIKYNSSCDLVCTVSEGLRKYWTKTSNKPVQVIYNGFFQDDIYVLKNLHNTIDKTNMDQKKVRVTYAGTLYDRVFFIDYFLEAVGELVKNHIIDANNFELKVFGAFDIYNKIVRYGLKEVYSYGGFVKKDEVMKHYFLSDFLLFPLEKEENKENWKGILTGKIFEYLGVNLFIPKPILVIGNSFDEEKMELLKKSGCCIFLDSKQKVFDFFYNYIQNGTVSINPNKDFISFFSRENQARILLSKIKEIL
ncbi:MAG: hypothetical protein ABDH21_00585 [bacterium]